MLQYFNSPKLEILEKAKAGDDEAKLFIINKYKKLILKYSNSYHLKNYDVDDLIQIGNLAVLNSINKYNSSKGSRCIDSYMINSIKNAYGTLARNNIKYSNESSLNILVKNDDYISEIVDLIKDNTDIINDLVDKSSLSLLNTSLNSLSNDEKTLIKEVYLTKKGNLLKYCKANNLPYTTTRTKLKSILKILRQAIN